MQSSNGERSDQKKGPALVSFGSFTVSDDTPDFFRSLIVQSNNSAVDANAEKRQVQIGDIIDISALQSFVRVPGYPLNPIFASEALSVKKIDGSDSHYEAKFQFQENGWHYGWTGGRFLGKTTHVFRVYILRLLDQPVQAQKSGSSNQDSLDTSSSLNPYGSCAECVGILSSTPFTVYCSRILSTHGAKTRPGIGKVGVDDEVETKEDKQLALQPSAKKRRTALSGKGKGAAGSLTPNGK